MEFFKGMGLTYVPRDEGLTLNTKKAQEMPPRPLSVVMVL